MFVSINVTQFAIVCVEMFVVVSFNVRAVSPAGNSAIFKIFFKPPSIFKPPFALVIDK